MDEVRLIEQVNETAFHPLVLVFVIVAGILVIAVKRRYFLLPFLFACIVVPEAQRIAIGGLGLNTIRLLVVFGLLRIGLRKESMRPTRARLDTIMVLWTLASVGLNFLRIGTIDALVNRLGFASGALGTYLLFRVYFGSLDELSLATKTVLVGAVIVAVAMAVESRTGRNPFSVFGGVPELAAVRDGRIRSQGPFAHPILAGTFGACMLPLFAALLQRHGSTRALGILGVASAVAVTVASASSGPVASFAAAVVGVVAWRLRDFMRGIRRLILLCLIGLDLVMKAPVYALIGRMDIIGGSTGWHRYLLIDAFVKNYRDWFLLGFDGAANWGWGLQDITNQYILEGLSGGIVQMLLFILLIVEAFRAVGVGRRALAEGTGKDSFFVWAVGASLFAHMMSFLSVSYFDQNVVIWYMLLAMAATVGGTRVKENAGRAGPQLAANMVANERQ